MIIHLHILILVFKQIHEKNQPLSTCCAIPQQISKGIVWIGMRHWMPGAWHKLLIVVPKCEFGLIFFSCRPIPVAGLSFVPEGSAPRRGGAAAVGVPAGAGAAQPTDPAAATAGGGGVAGVFWRSSNTTPMTTSILITRYDDVTARWYNGSIPHERMTYSFWINDTVQSHRIYSIMTDESFHRYMTHMLWHAMMWLHDDTINEMILNDCMPTMFVFHLLILSNWLFSQ